MLMPNGLSQLDGVDTTYGLTGDPSIGQTAPGLPGNTEDVIVAALKANQTDPTQSSWPVVAGQLFDGLRTGIALPVALLEKLLQTIFGEVTDDFNDMGAALTAALTAFGERWFGITNAQSTANDAKREISELKAQFLAGSGSSYTDNLDYANAAYLPSPYTKYESGSGAGTYGPNGASALVWKDSGNGNRCTLYTRSDYHLDVGKFGAAMIMADAGEHTGAFCYLGAVNSSGTGVGVAVGPTQAGLVTFAAGVPSSVISPLSYTAASGDSWEIYYGTSAYPRGVEIRLNGTESWSNTDTGVTLSSDIYVAIGGSAVNFFFGQTSPASIGSYTFFDSSL
jgi:hypothetical protein